MLLNNQGDTDPNVSVISSKSQGKLYKSMQHRMTTSAASAYWHSDAAFENVQADYSFLKLTKTPTTGGASSRLDCTKYIEYLITHNRDLQVWFIWNTNDVSIWDKPGLIDEREGQRTSSVGERPYLDPAVGP
ncbi:hypothetical protein ACEPAH_7238 [Sanghuangporus vaninii]